MKRHEEVQEARPGFLLIDAWRAEADLFERDEKAAMALRLRLMANKAQWLMRVYATVSR